MPSLGLLGYMDDPLQAIPDDSTDDGAPLLMHSRRRAKATDAVDETVGIVSVG